MILICGWGLRTWCSCTDLGKISLSEPQHVDMASNSVVLQLSLVFITILSADGIPSPTTTGTIAIDNAF